MNIPREKNGLFVSAIVTILWLIALAWFICSVIENATAETKLYRDPLCHCKTGCPGFNCASNYMGRGSFQWGLFSVTSNLLWSGIAGECPPAPLLATSTFSRVWHADSWRGKGSRSGDFYTAACDCPPASGWSIWRYIATNSCGGSYYSEYVETNIITGWNSSDSQYLETTCFPNWRCVAWSGDFGLMFPLSNRTTFAATANTELGFPVYCDFVYGSQHSITQTYHSGCNVSISILEFRISFGLNQTNFP